MRASSLRKYFMIVPVVAVSAFGFSQTTPAIPTPVPSVPVAEVQIDCDPPILLTRTSKRTYNFSTRPQDYAISESLFSQILDTSNLTLGPHMLAVRVFDRDGAASQQWGEDCSSDQRVVHWFRVEGNAFIKGAQAYIADASGAAPGVELQSRFLVNLLPADGVFDSPDEAVRMNVDTESLAPGIHTFYIRFLDQDDVWSTWRRYSFEVAPEIQPRYAEWTTNVNSEVGSGNAMLLASVTSEGTTFTSEPINLYDFDRFPLGARPRLTVRIQDNRNFHYNYELVEAPPDRDRGGWSDAQIPSSTISVDRCAFLDNPQPALGTIDGAVGLETTFSVTPFDPDSDPLPQLSWFVDGNQVANQSDNTFAFTPTTAAAYRIQAVLAAGTPCEERVEWLLNASAPRRRSEPDPFPVMLQSNHQTSGSLIRSRSIPDSWLRSTVVGQ